MKSTDLKLIAKVVKGKVYLGDPHCPTESCPAIIRTPDERAFIVGKKLTQEELTTLKEFGKVSVNEDEYAVAVPIDLITKSIPEIG